MLAHDAQVERRAVKALLAIYAIATLSDYATTAWALARGGVERNPFAASLYAEHGIEALLYAKLIGVVVMAVGVWLMLKISRFQADLLEDERYYVGLRWFTFANIWLITLAQWLVVGSNLWQMRLYMEM